MAKCFVHAISLNGEVAEMQMTTIFKIVFILIGLYIFLGGALNWPWFMGHRKAQAVMRLIGTGGARIFYMLLGLILVIFGTLGLLGILPME